MSFFSWITIICLAVYLQSVFGVVFTGACPKTPQTYQPVLIRESNKNKSGYKVNFDSLLGISFADQNPSNLFKDFDISTAHLMSLSFSLQLPNVFNLEFGGEDVSIINTWYEDGESLSVESFLSYNSFKHKLDCFNDTSDTVKMWEDDYFMMIWSCKDAEPGFHDEALMAFETNMPERRYNEMTNPERHLRLMKDFNVTARKYLSKQLLDFIDWERKAEQEYPYIPFKCPVTRTKLIPYVLLVVGVILVMACARNQFWEYFNCRRNKITPVEG